MKKSTDNPFFLAIKIFDFLPPIAEPKHQLSHNLIAVLLIGPIMEAPPILFFGPTDRQSDVRLKIYGS